MRQIFSTIQTSLVIATIITAIGCGGSQEASVTGKVTLDDKALTKGNVAFYPAGETGTAANGTISSDGSYKVSTGQQQGLAAGEYVVTVIATEPPPDDATAPKLLTPEIYSRVETSPLKVTIVAGSNEKPLELKSK